MSEENVQPVAQIRSIFSQERREVDPLSESQSYFLTSVLINPQHPLDVAIDASKAEEYVSGILGQALPFGPNILFRRLAAMCPDLAVSPAVLLLCSDRITSPGIAVLYAYSIFRETQKRGNVIDIRYFCEHTVPWGFPKPDHLHTIWEEQKGRTLSNGSTCDNYIDHQEAWN